MGDEISWKMKNGEFTIGRGVRLGRILYDWWDKHCNTESFSIFQSIFKLSKSNPYFRKSPLMIFCSMVILEVWQHRNIYIVNTIFETPAPVSLKKNILRVILLCLFFMYFAHRFGLWLPCFPHLYFVGPSSQKMYVQNRSTHKSYYNSCQPCCPSFV